MILWLVRRASVRVDRGARTYRQASACRWVLALLVLLVPARAYAQVVKDTTDITNRSDMSFVVPGSGIGSLWASVTVVKKELAGVSIQLTSDTVVAGGDKAVLPHVVSNLGTAADAFALQAVAPAGWTVQLRADVNGNGQLDAQDTLITARLYIPKGGTARILAVVTASMAAPAGMSVTVALRATSTIDASVSGVGSDVVGILRAGVADVQIGKTVSKAVGTNGDTLTYSITWRNRGGMASTTPVTVRDTLEAGLQYVPGSMRLGGAAVTDAADGDGAAVAGQVLTAQVPPMVPNASGSLTFRAVLMADSTATSVSNVATASWDTASVRSQPARTAVQFAQLELTKELVGADSVVVGHDVQYRLTYTNRSPTIAARNVVLIDTLNAVLAFESADDNPVVKGQVVTWDLDSIAPNSTRSVNLYVKVTSAPPLRDRVTNKAYMHGINAGVSASIALGFHVTSFTGTELSIAKAAGVLEAGIGDPVPYAITLRNTGWASLQNIIVSDELPKGLKLSRESVKGADSVRVNGQRLTFFVPGALLTQTQTVVSYTAVVGAVGNATRFANRASAIAENGNVHTDTVSAWVNVRRGIAMQGRTVVGKVWVDWNDNGRQDPGELGVPTAQVVSADGQLVVSDKEGRFSFRDMNPGTHAIRLDTLGLPRNLRLAHESDEVALVESDGWITPRVNFRLVPIDTTACADTAIIAPHGVPVTLGSAVVMPAGVRLASRGPEPGAFVAKHDSGGVAGPMLPPLRSTDERATEEKQAFIGGPTVRLIAPADGAVLWMDHIFIGVKGEPGKRVRVFDGEKQIGEAGLRPDGSADFLNIPMTPGPHHLRVAMQNSFGQVRWDSVLVHRAGAPTQLDVDTTVRTLRAEATAPMLVHVRVLDQWGVPVPGSPKVTVDVTDATIEGTDADASSVGEQRQARADGTLDLLVRPGRDVGMGELALSIDKSKVRIPLRVLPSARALSAVGVAQVGVGAAPQSFGAVTVRGAISDETALSVSYDSRRGGDNSFFQRGYDPLDDSHYATYGDGSTRRVLSGATERLSVKLERGFDWVEFGDVQTNRFAPTDRLGSYQRSLPGVTTHLTTGKVTWNAFGSVTQQALRQVQLRGDGGTGPFMVGANIRPGTDQIAVEVRDQNNAARVISREVLQSFIDYDIDYGTGAVLLRRPIPSTDVYGNPMYLVATVERTGVGAARLVGGVRAETDLAGIFAMHSVDSLSLGLGTVHTGNSSPTGAGAAGGDLLSADVSVARQGISGGAELLHAQAGDSSAMAARARGSMKLLGDKATLDGEWMRVGSGFSASFDPRLASALSSLRVGGSLKLGDDMGVGLHAERQHFDQYAIDRQAVSLDAGQHLFGRSVTQQVSYTNDQQQVAGGMQSSVLSGKLNVKLDERANVWAEATHTLDERTVAGAGSRPDVLGFGTSYKLFSHLSLEAAHRQLHFAKDSGSTAVTSLNLKAEMPFGGQVWGGLDRASEARASHTATLGWNERLALGKGWSAYTMYERRFGIDRASFGDPLRAMPFAQLEPDRRSVAGGFEWLPGGDKAHFSVRGEQQGAQDRRGGRLEIAADLPMGPSMALLTFNDWSQFRYNTGTFIAPKFGNLSRSDRSLVGFALRPVSSDAFNALAKLEWRRSMNPVANVLANNGEDSRIIGSTDLLWAPQNDELFSLRYAIRWSNSTPLAGQEIAARSHYVGARAERILRGPVGVRLDGRMLVEQTSQTMMWNAAPSVLVRLDARFEIEGGYRFGNLIDRDFAANGQGGLFAAMSVRFTEKAFTGAGAFWRERVAREP